MSLKPYASNSMVFQAHIPESGNLIDQFAPMILILCVVGFLWVK